jgi:hypothetical protein
MDRYRRSRLTTAAILITILGGDAFTVAARAGDDGRDQAVQLGSRTAKGGFRNEEDICDAFNRWQADDDARAWLAILHGRLDGIEAVAASIPRGEKAKTDVEVRVTAGGRETRYGISIKLVSTKRGFNQIDKRWLDSYARMWDMPEDVHTAMKLFVGEVPPNGPSRRDDRMFLTELPPETQKRVVDFFEEHRDAIATYLLAGSGDHAAGWLLVTVRDQEDDDASDADDEAAADHESLEASTLPSGMRSVLVPAAEAAAFYGAGDVVITPAGNLRIGRITMQRKGGDGGRATAKMLQFKIDPTALFDREESGSLDPVSRQFAEPKQ